MLCKKGHEGVGYRQLVKTTLSLSEYLFYCMTVVHELCII